MYGETTVNYNDDDNSPQARIQHALILRAETDPPKDVTLMQKGARAGRVHRESVIDHLNEMMAQEYITPEEHAARVTHAQAAQTHDVLNMLTSDLPAKPLSRWNGLTGNNPAPRKSTEDRRHAGKIRRVAVSWALNLSVALAGELVPPAMTTSLAGRIAPMLIFGAVSVIWAVMNIGLTAGLLDKHIPK